MDDNFQKHTNVVGDDYQRIMDSVRESIIQTKAEHIYKEIVNQQKTMNNPVPKRDRSLILNYPL